MNSKKLGIGIGIIGLIVLVIIGILLFGGKKDVYKVTFVNDDSREVVEVEANDTVSRPSDPTKAGYVFKGWYKDSVEFDFDSKITEDITLTARWEKVEVSDSKEEDKLSSYTVEFNSNGGNAVSKQTVKEGKTAIKPANPTKTGYVFKGWYLNGVLYNFSTKVIKNITLIAKWEKIEAPVEPTEPNKPEEEKTYNVMFDTTGGSKVASQIVKDGKLATKPNDPTKEGYTFLGWYDGTTEFDFATKIIKDITLVAKWEKVEVPVEPEEQVEAGYKIEEIKSSIVGQVRLYLTKDGKETSGNADIVTILGKTVNKDIPKEGYITNKGIIDKVINIKFD